MARLHLAPGSVTPLGLLNDPDRSVQFYLDRDFEGGRIGVHPNDNTATVWLSTRDLLDLLREHGSPVQWAEI
jgi:Ala-tRNA(Pro) deacylase